MSTTQFDATSTDALNLLAGYSSQVPFFFTSPRGTISTVGRYFAVPAGPDLPTAVRGVLDLALQDGRHDPIVVGAIPFDSHTEPMLSVPLHTHRAGPLPKRIAVPSAPMGVNARTVEVPAGATYADGVRRAVARLRAGELEKVVLARALDITTDAAIDVGRLLRRLITQDPTGYTFALDLAPGTLVGNSPELLVSRRAEVVTANPLAGSIPRSPDPIEDFGQAQALLASRKDRREHALVAEAVGETLRQFCTDIEVPATPSLIRTATMWHLSTVVTGRLADPTISSLTLSTALHPTPAVCGTPARDARAAIADYEAFDRGFYTGLVGWENSAGDGEWVIALRCAVAQGHTARLYAGAGIVADSDPAAELAETTAKFRTILSGLGL